MEEQTHVDQDYLKGFNSGYLLAKHEPSLASQLAAHPNQQNEYFKGMLAGKQQHEREWAKSFSKGAPIIDEMDRNKENER